MHILFIIISIFPNAGKNTLHQLVPDVVEYEHFVLTFFDFPLIIGLELSAMLDG